MSKVLVAIMSANTDVCARNTKAIMSTYIKYAQEFELKNEYVFFFYVGGTELKQEELCDNVYKLVVPTGDGITDTFEKTVAAYKFLLENVEFDYFIRLNISAYLNIVLLDRIIDTIGDNIYCNVVNAILSNGKYLNELYPRGDFYMMSRCTLLTVMEKIDIVANGKDGIEHVDDVMFGACIIEAFGNMYFDRLKPIVYSYVPGNVGTCSSEFKPLSIVIRLKSVPPGKVSGFSWGDNQYRKIEPNKFARIYDIVNADEYDEYVDENCPENLNSLIVKDRPITIINFVNVSYEQLIDYYNKRGR